MYVNCSPVSMYSISQNRMPFIKSIAFVCVRFSSSSFCWLPAVPFVTTVGEHNVIGVRVFLILGFSWIRPFVIILVLVISLFYYSLDQFVLNSNGNCSVFV